MRTFYELQRPRHVARLFKTAEALVGAVLGAPQGGLGHFDPRPRAVEALKNLNEGEWLMLDANNHARRFSADVKDLEQPVEG